MLTHFAIVLRPLRTPKKCKRFFGLACCHLHLTHHKGRFYFVLSAKRLLRNLCVGCHLRTPRERPLAFRHVACCLQNNDRFVPKPLRLKCLRILPLFCVLYARLVKGLRLFTRLCLPSSSPKLPDGYCYAIFALTVKLWLAVPYARRKNASAFSA